MKDINKNSEEILKDIQALADKHGIKSAIMILKLPLATRVLAMGPDEVDDQECALASLFNSGLNASEHLRGVISHAAVHKMSDFVEEKVKHAVTEPKKNVVN